MNEPSALQIDVDAVVRARLPRYRRWIPGVVVRMLARIIRQDDLNEMLRVNAGRRDAEFASGVLSELGVTYSVAGEERMPDVSLRRVTFVSNHPLGALDGIILIDYLSRRYGRGVKFVVNDLLMAVEPLGGVFVPINKHGAQSRDDVRGVDSAFAADNPVIVFPAGLCSRRGEDGVVRDLPWQRMFVNKSIEHGRTVVPLFFDGENSKFFYNFAKFRLRTGLKFNFEMVLLPREIFCKRGHHFTIKVGRPIHPDDLRGGRDAAGQAAEIRDLVYQLKSTDS